MNSIFFRRLFIISSALGTVGVIFGAFGAHFLKSRLAASDMDIIRTGILYLFIHVIVLLFLILLARADAQSRLLRSAGVMFIIGIFLFSGSLFIIGTQSLTGLGGPFIGILTPFGGFCFITGWMMLTVYAFSNLGRINL